MSNDNQDPYVGYYPLQKGRGSAYEMVEDGNIPEPAVGPSVPRPDINITTVKWISTFLGFFGIDHFYARSPVTGVAKLLTGGGMGFWWLWDILQLWTEQDRVLNYGMTAPFDLLTGIGQGMFTDQPSNYKQDVPSFVVSLAKIFGFMGFYHMVAGETAPGIRMLIIGIVGIVIGYGLIDMIFSIIYNRNYWLIISVFFLLIPFSLFIGNVVMELASYGLIDTEGSSVKTFENKILNYFNHGPGDNQDRKDITIHAIKEDKIRPSLALRHKTEPDTNKVQTGFNGNPFMAIPYAARDIARDIVKFIIDQTPAGKAANALKNAAEAAKAGPAGLLGDTGLGPAGLPAALAAKAGLPAALRTGANPLAAGANPLAALVASASPLAASANPPAASANPPAASANPPAASAIPPASSAIPPAASASPPAASASPKAAPSDINQTGGARDEITVESQILGASVAAIVGGGSIKFLVDYLTS